MCLVNLTCQVIPIRQRAVGLIGLADGADRGVEFGPYLRLVLGFKEMADGSEAMASPPDLAQIHYDVAHGLSPHLKVDTFTQANAVLTT